MASLFDDWYDGDNLMVTDFLSRLDVVADNDSDEGQIVVVTMSMGEFDLNSRDSDSGVGELLFDDDLLTLANVLLVL